MEPHFIEIVEIGPGKCGAEDEEQSVVNDNIDAFVGGGNVPIIDPNFAEFDIFLGGDDLDENPNTYFIGGAEYVFDNVKFAFLQHLYDLESGNPSTIDPDKILSEMYSEASDLVTVKQAAKDVICGFECFVNGTLLRLERAGKLTDMVAVIPPKPDFCHGADLDVFTLHKYLVDFNISIKLTSGATIEIKFNIPEYKEITDDSEIRVPESHPYAHIYAKFKETENKGRKMLSELTYLDSSLHTVIENINKLREIIATQI
jgi:hypothetical protein